MRYATAKDLFRWRKIMDVGAHATVEEFARAWRVNATHLKGNLRLVLTTTLF